jgi:predicted metal-binding membrane protein
MSVTITAGEYANGRVCQWAKRRVSRCAFFGLSSLLFTSSVAVTVVWCGSMSAMGEMPMPGGWTMSMAWMRMPGQSWLEAGASFLGMWVVMMVAMMLPCLIPTLSRYHQAIAADGGKRPGWLTMLVGAAYFFVWTGFGMVIFPVGATLAELEMRMPALSRAVPFATAVVILTTGAFQFTRWKKKHLACCQNTPERHGALPRNGSAAWREGVRLGVSCSYCCAGLMTILLVLGVMDLRTMACVTLAITAERLAPAGEIVARVIGGVVVGMGFFMVARVAGLC